MNTAECSRCLLTNDVPGVKINDDGLCSVCQEHDRDYGDWNRNEEKRLSMLEKILYNARKKKRIYDVLVPVSGGKDSVYILYLCRKHYNLKCLAVTFDNGFLSAHARDNIRNACEVLDVDHQYYGLSKPLLMRLYRYFFLNTGFFCPVCMSGIRVATTRTQIAFNIPLSIKGTSLRTEEHISPEFFLPGSPSFLENVLKGNILEKEAEVLLSPVGIFRSPPVIQMPDYINWDYSDIYNKIKNELGWKSQDSEEEHGDCMASNIVDYLRYKKFPVLVPEMLRFSKLITCGQMTKEEAAKKVFEKRTSIKEPGNLNWFLDTFGISKEELDTILADPMRHIKYLKNRSRVLRRFCALKKKRIRLI